MTRNVVNFNAGPAGLPEEALVRARDELLDFQGTGMSIMEHSHRGKAYEAVHNEAIALTRELLSIPDTHDVLLLQGGASAMFATVPMNFLTRGKVADYVLTGDWSKKALSEAKLIGEARVAGTGEVGGKYVRIPRENELDLKGDAYVHLTSNNTIAGTEWPSFPNLGGKRVVADMSSDILSRRIDVSRFGLIYAGAQKNVGPSGLVVAIIDRAWMDEASTEIPVIFRYKTHAQANSLYNTPPTFGIYLMRNVLAWIKGLGGLEAIEQRNAEKAKIVYGTIDESGGFYRSPVEKEARSRMNIVFRLPTEELEAAFIKEATSAGLVGLKGHRSVGGCRASTYNAVSVEGAARLGDFMRAFAKKQG